MNFFSPNPLKLEGAVSAGEPELVSHAQCRDEHKQLEEQDMSPMGLGDALSSISYLTELF